MRSPVLLVLLAACATPQPATQPDVRPLVVGRSDGGTPAPPTEPGIRFRHAPATVGSRWKVSVRTESRGADGDEQFSEYESDFQVEVLAVDGPAPSRMKVHVDRNVMVFRGSPTPTPIDGKDYVVTVESPQVRDAAGSQAPPSETERVLAWFPDLGTRTRLDETLPDAPMRIGERRDDLATAILRIVHPTAWKLDAGRATLVRADTEVAEFDVSLDATSETGIVMHVTGPARVRLRDSKLAELELRGTYDAAGAGGTFELRRVVRPQ